MNSAEIVETMRKKLPVIFAHPMYGVMQYKRISKVDYQLTEDFRAPTNTHDGITVGVTLEDYNGRSTINVDPKYVHGYTLEEFVRMRKEFQKDYEKEAR